MLLHFKILFQCDPFLVHFKILFYQGLFQQFNACNNHTQSLPLFQNIFKFRTILPTFLIIFPFCHFLNIFGPFSEKSHAFYFLEQALDYEMLHIWDHLQNCYILKIKLLHLWEYEKSCYFLKLKVLHFWEYLKNCYFFTESAAFPGKSTNLV